MAANKLAHLVGAYQSDSDNDNDDSENPQRKSNAITTDWTQCTDANSGHPYYWNIVTKEVTWEMPIEYQHFIEQAITQNPNSLRKWILCNTDDNTPYYFNDVTREISWEKPDDFDPANSNPVSGHSMSSKRNELPHSNNSSDASHHGTAKTKLNLVPEYNSDDSDEESSKPLEKPLFPSSKNSNYVNCKTIKPIEIGNNVADDESQPEHQLHSPAETIVQKTESIPKEKPSFASIITGGRSPQHESVDINLYVNPESNQEETSNRCEETPSETEISQKTFQRKRRIEFNVSGVPAKRTLSNDDSNAASEVTKDSSSTVASLRATYSNFQKGETEFLDQQQPVNDADLVKRPISANEQQMSDEQQILEAKLNFLCQGRADVSPVQVIQIQLQALQAAHIAEALHSDYLLEWMKNISNDLIKLEADAAPDGWKCLWNREKALYCYENTTNGEIKWEYPEMESTEPDAAQDTVIADDAMDICTTPPPNEHEDLSAFYQTSDCHTTDSIVAAAVPAPPKWSTNDTAKNNIEKPLDDELASFYSDIAKLHPEATNEENSCDKSPTQRDRSVSPEQSASDAIGDDKKKKKKKKPKKLEPWRSGNLETWINKWQKAQKELDG